MKALLVTDFRNRPYLRIQIETEKEREFFSKNKVLVKEEDCFDDFAISCLTIDYAPEERTEREIIVEMPDLEWDEWEEDDATGD